MTKPPLPLDEWRRWIETLEIPCALVREGGGAVEEVLPSRGFRPPVGLFAPGKPFPPDGGSAEMLCFQAPFLGDHWYWVSPRSEQETLLSAFALFLDRVPVPFFILDEARRVVLANDRFRSAVGTPHVSSPHPAGGDFWEEDLARAFAGETRDIETDCLFGRRAQHYYRVILVPVRLHADGPPRLVLGTFWEITELHRALQALKESEARFRALFDCSPEGLLTLSADGFVLQTNRIVCAISGWSPERLRSQPFATFFPEEERPRLEDLLRRAAENGATLRAEVSYRHPENGAQLSIYLVAVPLQDLGAERFLILLQDRSRLRLLENRAEQTERRFEELFQSSPDVVFTCLSDGTLLAFNRRAADLFGWSDATVGGRLGREVPVVPWLLVEGWSAQVAARARAGAGPLRSTCSFVDSTGLKRTFLIHAAPFPGDPDHNLGLTVYLHDETESRLLQERLAESREQFRSLVEHSPDVIFQISPDWRVLYVNPTARTMLGEDPDSLVGRPLRPSRFLPRDHCRRLNHIGAEALRRDGIQGELVQVRRSDGTSFWGQLSLLPLVQEGRLKSILGRLRDVDTLFQAQQQLERQAQALRQTVYQLEEAGRAQEQFAANVTHELRTPLTTILVTSEVLDRYLGPGAAAPQRHQLELIRNNARILQDLINDLLDLAKLKRGKFQPRSHEFALDALLQGLRDTMEPLFARKGLTFAVRVGPGVPAALRTDEEMLRKVLANLLSNACKFTRQGRVSFDVEVLGESLAFRVTDTGPGISPADLPRIFEEFRQLDSSDARREPGTGLGLSIADRFTTLLGGRIDVTSAEGQGSVFSVVLPLSSVTP